MSSCPTMLQIRTKGQVYSAFGYLTKSSSAAGSLSFLNRDLDRDYAALCLDIRHCYLHTASIRGLHDPKYRRRSTKHPLAPSYRVIILGFGDNTVQWSMNGSHQKYLWMILWGFLGRQLYYPLYPLCRHPHPHLLLPLYNKCYYNDAKYVSNLPGSLVCSSTLQAFI
ncbi:unnamed protein product [Absidia cylindrospora]